MTANLASVAQRSALPRITRFRVPLADYRHRTGEFLIGGLLAPSVTLLTGASEAGKSTLARHIVLSLLSDAPLMGETDHRRHVIHWAGTDSGWRDEFKKDAAKLPGLVDHDERLCLFPDGADIGSFDKDDWTSSPRSSSSTERPCWSWITSGVTSDRRTATWPTRYSRGSSRSPGSPKPASRS